MKHFATLTGTEHLSYMEPSWPGMKRIQRKSRSSAKLGYRRRERAALKRLVRAYVESETIG